MRIELHTLIHIGTLTSKQEIGVAKSQNDN